MELQRRIRNDLNYTDKEWNKVVTLNHQRSKVNNAKMADKERNKLRVGVGRAKIKKSKGHQEGIMQLWASESPKKQKTTT